MADDNQKLNEYLRKMLDVMLFDPELRDQIQAGIRVDTILSGRNDFQIDLNTLLPLLQKDPQGDRGEEYKIKQALAVC